MYQINVTSFKFLQKLLALIPNGESSVKIANNDTFMAVHVEKIGRNDRGELVSIAHYGEQNGDAMRDPDMVFEVWESGARPLSFRNDYLGVFRETCAYDEEGKLLGYYKRELADQVRFASQWFRNIKAQQF